MIVLAIIAVIVAVIVLTYAYRVHRFELPILTERDAEKGMRPLTSAVLEVSPRRGDERVR